MRKTALQGIVAQGTPTHATIPTFLDASIQSRDPRLQDLGTALDEGAFATSGNILDTAHRTLVKKLGLPETLARTALSSLTSTPGVVLVAGADKWSQLKHEALGATYTKLAATVPEYLAHIDDTGAAIDPKDPGIDGEDLAICTTLTRLARQLAPTGRHPVLYTADRYLAHGAPHILTETPPATKQPHHAVWYEYNGGRWDCWLTLNIDPVNQNAYLHEQHKNAAAPTGRHIKTAGPAPNATRSHGR